MSRNRQIPRVLLLIETSRAYGRGIVEGITRYAIENGPWSIQFEDRGREASPPLWLNEWRGQGIIARSITKKLATMLWNTGIPLVELHGDGRIGTAEVTCDDLARMNVVEPSRWNPRITSSRGSSSLRTMERPVFENSLETVTRH